MRLYVMVGMALMMAQFMGAYTDVIVHVDDTGKSLVFGESDVSVLVLPDGVGYDGGMITGETQGLTSKDGEVWSFDIVVEGAEIQVFLPSGAVVRDVSAGELFVEERSFRDGSLVLYGVGHVGVLYVIGEDASDGSFVVWLVGVIFLGGVVLVVLFLRRRFVSGVDDSVDDSASYDSIAVARSRELLEHVLSDRERVIVDVLRRYGRIKSSYVRKLSGIPKASFFRHIVELEKKGLIVRNGEGRNKFVELTEYGK